MMSKVRNGVTIKLRKEVHQRLSVLQSRVYELMGKKPTFSDIIEALISTRENPASKVAYFLKEKSLKPQTTKNKTS